ncbi:uncharacterized protein LOC143519155 [Brachyhypopomus gauderio]|uniref:uncharacterized protein LOC143519155 n=1 Tax=Brachyhypopomus gauderio TaxID=698409 RepID=UPI004042B45C
MESSPTIGEFLQTLSEMGFTENQIQSAIQAGCLSVPEAAEWLVHDGSPRHRLVKQPQSSAGAFSAFNPPKDAPGCSTSAAPQSKGTGLTLVLNPAAMAPGTVQEPPPVESRIKQDTSNFQEQQRQRLAKEVQVERKQKKQERELILKRIAEDRHSQQDKALTSPPKAQEQRLGGQVHPSIDNQCTLMIRLPSGASMRERFPADSSLSSVVEHIASQHPSLPAFTLVQGFPRRRFSEAELACSLHSLGLTPNASLCVQAVTPVSSQDAAPPTGHVADEQENPAAQPTDPQQQEAAGLDQPGAPQPFPHQLWAEAAEHAGIQPPHSGISHHWGRGQRLVSGEAEDELPEEAAEPLFNGLPPFLPYPEHRIRGGVEPPHFWPDQGNRLREPVANEPASPEESRMPGQAAAERLQRAGRVDEPQAPSRQPSPPKKALRSHSVPSLCALAKRATVSLMTAPRMQYTSSLSGLTPQLAELLLGHMASERLLRPRTLELFFGCPLGKFVLNSYPYATNELLRQLRAFPALKHLSLVNSQLITDAALSVLSGLLKLQHLNLSSCNKLTDCCLQHISNLKCLSFLALDKTKVSDAGLLPFLRSAPPALSHLSLNETAVTEATLSALPTCVPQLRLLSIARTMVSDVSSLVALPCLHTLHLDGTRVREDSLRVIAALPSIAALSIASIPVADGNHTLEIISGLRLTQLTLPGRLSVTDAGLPYLAKQTLLTELDLTDYTQLTDQGISHLASMTRLKKLSLSNTQVSDVGLASLKGLRELLELCLNRTAVTSRGVAAVVTHLPYLQVIGLASTPVGDTVLKRGVVHCTQLLKLNLSRTRITDHGLKFLYRMRLSQVNLDGTGVTLEGVSELVTACPHLTSVRASNTRTIPAEQQSDDDDGAAGVLMP